LLKDEIVRAMEAYDIITCYERLRDFIEDLNNWYIRLSRRRFWTDDAPESKRAAYEILYTVLRQFCVVASPFLPFLAEEMYRGLCGAGESAHLQDWPAPEPEWSDPSLVREVAAIQRVITLGRSIRERHNIKVRQPLALVRVAGLPAAMLEAYREEILTELNLKEVEPLENPGEIVRSELKPDARVLGPRLGRKFKETLDAARAGAWKALEDGRVEVAGIVLEPTEFRIERQAREAGSGCAAEGDLVVVLSLHVDRALLIEGVARELVRATQELRKTSGLAYTDRIRLSVSAESPEVSEALAERRDWIMAETLAIELSATPLDGGALGEAEVEVAETTARIALARA